MTVVRGPAGGVLRWVVRYLIARMVFRVLRRTIFRGRRF
jgi:hypothetical protein